MPQHSEVLEAFRQLGISYTSPGFYDDPAFIAAENQAPAFLETYADYIETRVFDQQYLSRARQEVEAAALFLYRELVADGRLGACIDASLTLSRFLERQGIWNYVVKGALTIRFPDGSGVPTSYFQPIMATDNPAMAGHVWLCAPPFRIVDITITQQPYDRGQDCFLTEPILAEAGSAAQVETADMIEEEAVSQFAAHYGRVPTLRDLQSMCPDAFSCMKKYGVIEIAKNNAVLKYIPCGISAPDAQLEESRGLCLSGKYSSELYEAYQRARY